MAGRLRLIARRFGAWAGLAAVLALGALLAWPWPPARLDWQPALFFAEPWRALSGALVHWSRLHLLANLLGCTVLAWLGQAAALPGRAVLAWALAWPLTQIALLLRPDLQQFGGLSGVLHAGVAICAVELLARRGREQGIGLALALGLALKLALERPLGPALRQMAGWDIAIAPLSHLSGAAAGTLSALLMMGLARRRA